MWTQRWIPRDPRKVVDEMEHHVRRYQIRDFQFQDLTAIVRKDWIVEFCREILRRKSRRSASTSFPLSPRPLYLASFAGRIESRWTTSICGLYFFNPRFSDVQITAISIGGLVLFYGVRYLLRPHLLIRLFGEVFGIVPNSDNRLGKYLRAVRREFARSV